MHFSFIFQNADAEDGWAIRQKAIAASKVLLSQIERQLDAVLNTQSSEEVSTYIRSRLCVDPDAVSGLDGSGRSCLHGTT
jgi:hypothetical protein